MFGGLDWDWQPQWWLGLGLAATMVAWIGTGSHNGGLDWDWQPQWWLGLGLAATMNVWWLGLGLAASHGQTDTQTDESTYRKHRPSGLML